MKMKLKYINKSLVLQFWIVTFLFCSKSQQSRIELQSEITKTPTCKIHNKPLFLDTVPIVYGLIRFTPIQKEEFRVKDSIFPNAQDFVIGGCIVDENNPKMKVVYKCPTCILEKAKWVENQKALLQNDKH
jgi:hypothetical protein